MPTYEYECSAGHRYEKREGFDAPAAQRCAQCRRMARRLFHAPPIMFKGSGFYVTDSRKSEPASESGAKVEASESSGDSEPVTSSSTSDTSDKPAKADKPAKPDKAPSSADSAAAAS